MRVAKWGNSMAIRIPREVADKAGLHDGAEVELELAGKSVVIRRSKRGAARKYTAGALVRRINSGNIHRETDWGAPVGDEIW
ncbi:MAG TPA: AbrB/MazE/SpoVT family DNA-binding domain-containing protein [Candidatus Binataceae bacterium]|nr:AbrB/MazE/SpoVT family DNA-binding domain-containing protein [Candidatus Binataceae bacterium]